MDDIPYRLGLLTFEIGDYFFVNLTVFFVLLFCSALLSGAEVAFFSLTNKVLDDLRQEDSLINKIVLKLLSEPKRLLATILISNNTVNIAMVLLFDVFNPFKSSDEMLVLGFISVDFILEVGIVTFILLIFGEIFPKVYANRNGLKFSRFMAYPLYVLDFVLRPLNLPMQKASSHLQKKLNKEKSNLSVGHLSHALELTKGENTFQQERKILEGIVSFGKTETRQIMRPRIDVYAINEDTEFSEVLEKVMCSMFSRIPIYKDSLDNITGVLYSKDLLEHMDKKGFKWQKLKREAYFVPEMKKLDDLLAEFQEKKIHLAIVVDEYGGTLGIVTLEDIIEEIVGDISDELDHEYLWHSKLDDYNYVFEGKTMLRDFYRIVDLDSQSEFCFEQNKGESETLAGFVLEISGSFPKKNDNVRFEDFNFLIEAIDKKRIKQIKVTLPKQT